MKVSHLAQCPKVVIPSNYMHRFNDVSFVLPTKMQMELDQPISPKLFKSRFGTTCFFFYIHKGCGTSNCKIDTIAILIINIYS